MSKFTEKLGITNGFIRQSAANMFQITDDNVDTFEELVNEILDQLIQPVFNDLTKIYVDYKKSHNNSILSIMKDIKDNAKDSAFNLMKDVLVKNNSLQEYLTNNPFPANMTKELFANSLDMSLFIIMLHFEQNNPYQWKPEEDKDEFNKIMRDVI